MHEHLQGALELAARGLPVFPLQPRSKQPYAKTRGFLDASLDPEQIRRWFQIAPDSNVGVNPPPGVLVVDVDPRNGGVESVRELEAKHGGFPDTLTAKTGGGGLHAYFRVPANLGWHKELARGIDLKGPRGYLVAPPSVHDVTGQVYEWLTPLGTPIAEAPAWLVAKGYVPTERIIVVEEGESGALPESEVARTVAELAPRFEAGKKHGIAFALGGWLRQRGWNQTDIGRVVEQLPSKNTRARVKDALDGYRAANDHGWHELRLLLGEGPAAVLDSVTPNPRRARELEERASAAEMAAAMVSSVVAQSMPGIALRASTPANDDTQAAPQTAVPVSPLTADQEPKPGGKQLTTADVVDLLAGGVWADVLGYDLLAGRVMCLREPPMRAIDNPGTSCMGEWTDAHTARARTWISSVRGGREPSKDATDAAVEIVARRRAYHPVQNYLASLRWDGVPRLDRLLACYFGADLNDYTSQVGAKTLIAAVARATRPGAKVDTMTILEGAQGIGKSRAVRALVPVEGWFADTPLDLESKDAAQCLQGKWIYEIGELHSFNRSETTRIKAFVSSQADNLRPSYGRRNQDFPRQCVFIGTTNGTEYLSDTTGNRRYWPVRCRAIDVIGLQRDRDQLWAEAATRYAAGERWWLEGSEVALAEAQQADREAVDPWEAELAAWLDPQHAPGVPRPADRAPFTMTEVLTGALHLGVAERTQATATRVGKLLARLGWKSKAMKDPTTHKVVRVYVRAAA